jgi:DNA helicase-2/ATP-dependent DNA helicase PcrA
MANDGASVVANTVPSEVFLELVNQVLKDVGREELPKAGPQQRIITIEPTDRVLQILAGPGSGKTEMLVWRVLYESFVLGVPAQRVMVTTFTRRAATELQVRLVERSDALMSAANKRGFTATDPKVHDLRVGTIHSLCDSLLAEFDTGYVENGTQLIDDIEVGVRIARDYRLSLGYNNPPKPPRVLNRLLSNPALTLLFRPAWDDNATWPSTMMERVNCILAVLDQHIETWVPRCAASGRLNGIETVHGPKGQLTDDLIKLQQRWEEYLNRHNIQDFATIQKRFLEKQTSIADHLTHVFVDEFQDNNPIQFAIHTGWLSRPDVRLTVVGDDDQAIYRFRGSDIECFNQLYPFCIARKVSYRTEKLETNYRSTKSVVDFSQDFRNHSVLESLSMPKNVVAAPKAANGRPVRLLEGPWLEITKCVAAELKELGVGTVPAAGQVPPSAAVLMFSTSERSSKSRTAAAIVLRQALEASGVRTYNPRSKTAGSAESPVAQLFGLISYLIDPISYAPAGKDGRQVMVASSMNDSMKRIFALSKPPTFPINEAHLSFQKKFFKSHGGNIGQPSAECAPLIQLLDRIRAEIAKECDSGRKPRLTLAGLVSRLLACPFFRNCGFTRSLFRQALFTALLEANIAPTRLTMHSLDQPLEVRVVNRKYQWPDRFWILLNVFGAYLNNATIDDPEVESFEEDAVLMLTFHQTKGLEFDHIYVAGTGRAPDLGPALRTKLFSGDTPKYRVDGTLSTRDKLVCDLAVADRDREVYVAITRAKKSLTLLCDPKADLFMSLNPAIQKLFAAAKRKSHALNSAVFVKEYEHNG